MNTFLSSVFAKMYSRKVEPKKYSRNVELRKVKPEDLKPVFTALDSLDSWKLLMEKIPKRLCSKPDEFVPKYNYEHMRVIEREGRTGSCWGPTRVLLDEWGTSGQIRPTLETLLDLLIDNDLFRAADIVAEQLLGGLFLFVDFISILIFSLLFKKL